MPSRYVAPNALLQELGITEPEDIDVEAIAQHCGATVRYKALEGTQARIVGIGEKAIIAVNRSSRRPRQRFSIGHELGHWMRDHGTIGFSCTDKMFIAEWSDDNPERRANRYAAGLLLPEFMFGPLAKNQHITLTTVRTLAKRFNMSLVATAIRLVELGSFPCMIVCNDLAKRRWFFRATDISLWPTHHPGRDTIAYDLLRGDASGPSPQDVCADGWIDHPDAGRYELSEDSVKIPIENAPDLVISLLWWKDERQLLDLEDDE
jgi:Zn-dependent peptidase ImmA (M78 family)